MVPVFLDRFGEVVDGAEPGGKLSLMFYDGDGDLIETIHGEFGDEDEGL